MKAQLQLFLWFASLMATLTASSQTYTSLHDFSSTSGSPPTNNDGANPYGSLILSSNLLYGTTHAGGTNGAGDIYSMHSDGSSFTNLYSFSQLSPGTSGTNTDGASPTCPLLVSGDVLFGTAYEGGVNGSGSIFRVNTDGSHYTNLYSFPANAGLPRGQLILASNVLFGTASVGGGGFGSVYRINTDGTDFTNLVVFSGTTANPHYPNTGLALTNGVLYGVTSDGGGSTSVEGVIFAVGTGGGGYSNIFTFQPTVNSTNATGAEPFGTLLVSGGMLYGTAEVGGNGSGVVFSLNTNGSNFTVLHAFSVTTNSTNSDGAGPVGALLLANGVLYGTAVEGGTTGKGSIYSVNTNGSNFMVLYDFINITNNNVNIGGYGPVGGLIISGSNLYGTTLSGGAFEGNIYSLSLAPSLPELNYQVVGGNLVLSWSDPAFSLQSATNLGQTFATIANAATPYTTNFTGPQQYFRLKQ